jgi:hypothetical protein
VSDDEVKTLILPNGNGYALNEEMYRDFLAMREWWRTHRPDKFATVALTAKPTPEMRDRMLQAIYDAADLVGDADMMTLNWSPLIEHDFWMRAADAALKVRLEP